MRYDTSTKPPVTATRRLVNIFQVEHAGLCLMVLITWAYCIMTTSERIFLAPVECARGDTHGPLMAHSDTHESGKMDSEVVKSADGVKPAPLGSLPVATVTSWQAGLAC